MYVFFFSNEKPDGALVYIIPLSSLLFLFAGYLVYRFLEQAKTVEYDEKNIYITGKAGIESIPYKRVVALKIRPGFMLNDYFGCSVSYTESNGVKTVLFFPRLLQVNLKEFSEMVLINNKDVKMEGFFGNFSR